MLTRMSIAKAAYEHLRTRPDLGTPKQKWSLAWWISKTPDNQKLWKGEEE
jgi:hypothetical protein